MSRSAKPGTKCGLLDGELFGLGVLVALALLFVPVVANAQLGLRVNELAQGSIRVDGMLRDWQGLPFAEVGSTGDSSMRYAIGYDEQGMYVGAEVRDERFIRTTAMGNSEDSIVVTLAIPARAGLARTDVWLFSGQIGRTSGAAFVTGPQGRQRAAQGRVVEGPRPNGNGYVLEGFVPWAALNLGDDWQRGRGAVRLRDVDSEARPVVREHASAPLDRLDLLPPLLPTGGPAAALAGFMRERGIEASPPRFDLTGDVVGDGRPERVVVVDRFAVIVGPGFRDGRGYSFQTLTTLSPSDIRSVSLVDLTADGQRELVVNVRDGMSAALTETWQVFRLSESGEVSSALRLDAAVTVTEGRGSTPPEIIARAAPDHGTPFLERTYRWDGTRFAVLRETPRPVAPPPPPRHTAPAAVAPRPSAEPRPSIDDLLNLFRTRQGLDRNARPRWHNRANVAAGPQPEEVYVFGATLVVLGPGFFGGTQVVHLQLPANDPDDVLDVRCDEATGDDRAEIFVLVRQALEDVRREVLHVYRFTPNGIGRILAVELHREQRRRRIHNEWRIEGEGTERHIVVTAGRARAWNASNWGFTEGTGDGVEPLLLPWVAPSRAYRLEGPTMTGSTP